MAPKLNIIFYHAIPFGIDSDDEVDTGAMGGAFDVLDDFGPERVSLGCGVLAGVGFHLGGETLDAVGRHTRKPARLGME